MNNSHSATLSYEVMEKLFPNIGNLFPNIEEFIPKELNVKRAVDSLIGTGASHVTSPQERRLLGVLFQLNPDVINTGVLSNAAGHGDIKAVKLILKIPGVKVDAVDGEGDTALIMAARTDNDSVAKVLIKAGAEINHRGDHGMTSVGWAALFGSSKALNTLIDAGADVNIPSKNKMYNRTPVMDAAFHNGGDQLGCIKLLVENGARLDFTNKEEGSVLDIAKRNGDEKRIEYLVSKGAKIAAQLG